MSEQQLVALLPLVAMLLGVAFAIFALYLKHKRRQMYHRERMAAIEKGLELAPEDPLTPHAYLLRGLIWLFVGVGIAAFFLAMSMSDKDPELPPMATLGLIPAGVGLAYLILYHKEGKRAQQPRA